MAATKPRKYTHEELMMEVIKEGRKSIPEHTDKTDPLVGAIIASPDGEILARAHRGELRVGEHCEYTLIERKLKSNNLLNCILYVTLEPCTDASRKLPKRGCCSHIAKARLAQVYVGIEDPNPKIATEGIKHLMQQGVRVSMFPDHLSEIIRTDNSKFIKEKEAEAIAAKKPAVIPKKSILEKPAIGATFKSFSTTAIDDFLKESGAEFKYPSPEFNQWAEEFTFLEKTNSGELVPTGLGIILFGNSPHQQFPQTVFKVEIEYGDNQTEIRDFTGPLVLQMPAILEYVKERALKLTIDRKGKRTTTTDFPFEILREAISNAIIHRDYHIEGSTNYLRINPNKIILRSPGGPMDPLTIQDLQKFDTPSLSRNPKIMYVFNQMEYAEQRGIGLRSMSQLPDHGYPLPLFEMRAGALEVTFTRDKRFSAKTAAADKELNDEDRKVVMYVQKEKEVTVSELAKYLAISIKSAQRRLNDLVKLDLISTVGENRWRKYIPKIDKKPVPKAQKK